MKNEEEYKQEKLQNESKKHGKIKSIPESSSINYYETVPLRIKTELMSAQECERLKRITARDTRIIRDYLRIIFHNEDKQVLVNGQLQPLIRQDFTVNISALDKLTLTTFKKGKNKLRSSVPHDLKKRFPRCSVNEFQGCSKKAIWTYESWKRLQQRSMTNLNKPKFKERIPRPLYPRTTKGGWTIRIHPKPNNPDAKLWLEVRDSLDSKRAGKTIHQKLWLPLAFSP